MKPQAYFKQLEFALFDVRSLEPIEMIAEKVRAAYQRAKVRDLYDLHRFATTPFDGELLRRLVVLKLWQVRDPVRSRRVLREAPRRQLRLGRPPAPCPSVGTHRALSDPGGGGGAVRRASRTQRPRAAARRRRQERPERAARRAAPRGDPRDRRGEITGPEERPAGPRARRGGRAEPRPLAAT